MFGLGKPFGLGRPPEPTHVIGTHRGEEVVRRKGREPGRKDKTSHRTARDSTSVNPGGEKPIDSRMPNIPPA
jgi:hypothetical protein